MAEEHFDVLDASGALTGRTAPRSVVHGTGLYHRAVHTWLFCPATREVLLQQRAACKDSWPSRWDISSAGHLSAGQNSLDAAQRELQEELGITLPPHRFRLLFVHLEELASVQRGKPFVNNEFNDVYLITVTREERLAFDRGSLALQAEEVSDVKWLPMEEVVRLYEASDASIVPSSNWASYKRLFDEMEAVASRGDA